MPNGQPTNATDFFSALAAAQQHLDAGFAHLPPNTQPALNESAAAILHETATRLHDNYPYAHPLYAGQMLKPPHPIARAAYALAMSINPNNHALDGGRASSAMELEAVAALAKMFGLPNTSATSPAAAPSPTSKPSGSPANSPPAKQSPPPTKPTTPTAASPASSTCPSHPSPPTPTAAWTSPPSNKPCHQKHRHRSRHHRHHRHRLRRSAPRNPQPPAALQFPHPRRRRLRRLLHPRPNLSPETRPHSPQSPKPTPSSSTPTSTASSPTAADASSSATPPSAASTNTTPPTPTSPPPNSTSAKSPSSAPAPEPPP